MYVAPAGNLTWARQGTQPRKKRTGSAYSIQQAKQRGQAEADTEAVAGSSRSLLWSTLRGIGIAAACFSLSPSPPSPLLSPLLSFLVSEAAVFGNGFSDTVMSGRVIRQAEGESGLRQRIEQPGLPASAGFLKYRLHARPSGIHEGRSDEAKEHSFRRTQS